MTSTLDWSKVRVAIVGAGGMLGRDLHARLAARMEGASDRLIALTREDMDISDDGSVRTVFSRIRPDMVINCAAYTNVDGCESNIDLAMSTNADGPRRLADVCRSISAKLVHFSTDFVFDGRSERPYGESDEANPISTYGRSKWQGEMAVRESGCNHLLIRTSWLVGRHGRSFVDTILSKARAGETLRVVNDQVGRPTFAIDLVEGLLRLLEVGAEGTLHFANDGQCSWYEFAREIANLAALNVDVIPISSEQLARPAKRPAYSVLDLGKYTRLTCHTPPNWHDALRRHMQGAQTDSRIAKAACSTGERLSEFPPLARKAPASVKREVGSS